MEFIPYLYYKTLYTLFGSKKTKTDQYELVLKNPSDFPTLNKSNGKIVKRIVVVGGGYFGVNFISEMVSKLSLHQYDPSPNDIEYELVLITKRDSFVYICANLRNSVVDDVLDDSVVSWDNFLSKREIPKNLIKRGVIVGNVNNVDHEKNVINITCGLNESQSIEYDALVIATGCTWNSINEIPDKYEDIKNHFHKYQNEIKESKRICVIGGGPVGIELIGEISDIYKDKDIYLIHSNDKPLGNIQSNCVRDQLKKKLDQRKITQYYNSFGNVLIKENGKYEVEIENRDDGKKNSIEVDFVMITKASKPNSEFLDEQFKTEKGHIKTKRTFEIESSKSTNHNIFGIGDVIEFTENPNNIQEPKLAARAAFQIGSAVNNVFQRLSNETKSLPTYQTSFSSLIFVVVGRYAGAGQMASFISFPSFIVSKIKGTDLFTKKAKSLVVV